MANKKISELNSITYNNVDEATDLLAIVDDSTIETKKITIAEIRNLITQKALELAVSLKIGAGAIVSDIHTDLAANSDANLVTQKAVKTETDALNSAINSIDLTDFVTKSTAQIISGAKTFDTNNLNLNAVNLLRDGSFFLGNDDSGNILKVKGIFGSIPSGFTFSGGYPHGLANAMTNERVIFVGVNIDNITSLKQVSVQNENFAPRNTYYDNTNFYVERGGTLGNASFSLWIIYK